MDQLTHVCSLHNNRQDTSGYETRVNACTQAHMHKHKCNTAHIRAKAAPGGIQAAGRPMGERWLPVCRPFL